MLADSASNWPALREGCWRATEDTRRGLTAELLLMAFGSEEIGAWLDETHDDGQHDEVTCATLFDCVTNFYDEELLSRAVKARPYLHLGEFPLSASP